MLKKLREKLVGSSKEKWLLAVALLLTVFMSLWVIQGGKVETSEEPDELGLIIPKGYLIVPLELSNANAINTMVNRNGVVDVFASKQDKAIVENLRIVKLQAGEGPLFGALVPENSAGKYQEYFSRPKLRAAIRTLQAGPTKFHGIAGNKNQIIEVSVKED